MNREPKLLVCLFSDPNFLAVNILENLLSKNCQVKIVTEEKKIWGQRTKHLATQTNISFVETDNYKNISDFSYAIFCGGFLNKEKTVSDFKKFISNKNFGNAKTLAVFPFETFSLKESSKISISDNAGIIYLGDIIGPRIDLTSDLLLPKLISESLNYRSMTMGVGEILYPIFVADAAKTIVKWLLSFGPYGKETFLLGHQTSSTEFWKQSSKFLPNLKVLYDTKMETRFIPRGYDRVFVSSNLSMSLGETYKWIGRERPISDNKQGNNEKIKTKISATKVKKPKSKTKRFILFLIFMVLFLPFLTSIFSGGLLYLSFRQFVSGRVDNSRNLLLVSKTISSFGKSESIFLSKIPLLGIPYKETAYISLVGETLSDLSYSAMPLVKNGYEIFGQIFSDGIYDIKTPSVEIKSGLDYIYQQLSFFQISTQEASRNKTYSAKQVLEIVDFENLKNTLQGAIVLSDNLPSILGDGENRDYLVLFQNNMELRPTGGFIGSYAVAGFSGGRMNGLNINDVYSADGQLKGHVEPPLPIKNYLNEANWWFRDSNWNPDFPTSAGRAEWFLKKEMDQEVDGVIAIDLQPIKDILQHAGPIFLPDYNLTISSDNLYEKTQEEVQSNFFPGSRRKASFLTALSRSLISEIPKLSPKTKIKILKSLYDSLVGRHIQIYIHNEGVSDAVTKLGWDGSIQSYSCGDGCYSDFFADVEANVGVNKSNYFVKRQINFSVNVGQNKVSRRVSIKLENSANPALGLAGIYRTYMRILIPSDSTLVSVRNRVGQSEKNIQPEITQEKGRQEVGVMIEVNPKTTSEIIFEWQNTIQDEREIGSYGLFIRKQAGVENDPLSIVFSGKDKVSTKPTFTLTDGGVYKYNTGLDKDFFARLSWK